MGLPTLLIQGNLYSDDPEEKKILDQYIPIDYVMDWFKQRISKTGLENRVLTILALTASGKSTAIAPYLYKNFVHERGNVPGIIQTQPRVITAIGVVKEMLKNYPYLKLEKNIGWSTKYNKLRPKDTGLLSATIGTLTQMLKTNSDDEIMKKYKFILVDETHERNLQTDMAIYMLKNFLLRNRENPNAPFVVLMSATFDPQSLLDYFGVQKKTNFIWCRGESHGFDEMWDWNQGRTVNNYTQAASNVVEKILDENQDDDPLKADILIFLPGMGEIKETATWLDKLNAKMASNKKKVFSVLKIDGEAVNNNTLDYRRLDMPLSEHEITIAGVKHIPSRRVILSTNVAETGLTLENLKYVIDAGFNREVEYNPVYGIRGLITRPAPKSRVKQRRGRAGRKFRGVFYPLYPKYIHDKLPELQLPQILIEDISEIALDIVNEQLKAKSLAKVQNKEFLIHDIDMVDPPTPDALSSTLEKLYTIGLISPIAPDWVPELTDASKLVLGEFDKHDDVNRFGMTKLGHIARMFSMILPDSVRMILSAYSWGCSVLDMVTIAAFVKASPREYSAKAPEESRGPPPKINWASVYKTGMPGYFGSAGMLYKTRLLIADDFINGLILFNAVKNIITGGEYKKSIGELKKWCESNFISFRAILEFIRNRDEIIEQMLTLHMDIFVNEDSSLSKSTQESFMNIITKIKYCIYEGFRCNILTKLGDEYFTANGLKVTTPKLFRSDEEQLANASEYGFIIGVKPTHLVYKELALKYNHKTNMYDVVVENMSCLDGFVAPDSDFTV
jgi:HrpA-like RNA helicase